MQTLLYLSSMGSRAPTGSSIGAERPAILFRVSGVAVLAAGAEANRASRAIGVSWARLSQSDQFPAKVNCASTSLMPTRLQSTLAQSAAIRFFLPSLASPIWPTPSSRGKNGGDTSNISISESWSSRTLSLFSSRPALAHLSIRAWISVSSLDEGSCTSSFVIAIPPALWGNSCCRMCAALPIQKRTELLEKLRPGGFLVQHQVVGTR